MIEIIEIEVEALEPLSHRDLEKLIHAIKLGSEEFTFMDDIHKADCDRLEYRLAWLEHQEQQPHCHEADYIRAEINRRRKASVFLEAITNALKREKKNKS